MLLQLSYYIGARIRGDDTSQAPLSQGIVQAVGDANIVTIPGVGDVPVGGDVKATYDTGTGETTECK